ncbi:MAG: GNAT family N-acetyltransferase [Kurthia sp.]|nr:GNAT family N-acetyltransferase [Candidatus Kurthia equi]
METKRLLLVDYTEKDMPFIKHMVTNPKMMRYIRDGRIWNKQQTQEFYDRMTSYYSRHENYGLKLILDKNSHQKIGHAGLVPQLVDGEEMIEVGYWIDEPFWGKGYASEVAAMLTEYGLVTLQLPKLVSLIQYGNKASEKIAVKNGMVKDRDFLLSTKQVYLYITK